MRADRAKSAKRNDNELQAAPEDRRCPPSSRRASRRLADKAPDSGNWMHEIKFDGYRLQARLDHGKVKLLTRKGLDWTKNSRPSPRRVAKLPAETALIDGELVVGRARRPLQLFLAAAGSQGRPARPHGASMRSISCISTAPTCSRCRSTQRKAALAALLNGRSGHGPLRLSESLDRTGHDAAQARLQDGTRRHRLEARRRALPFRPRPRLAQDQMLRPAGIRRGRLRALDRGRARGRRAGAWLLSTTANCTMPGAPAPASPMKARARLYRKLKRDRGKPPFEAVPAEERGVHSRSGSSRSWWPKSISTAGPMATACGRPRFRACARTSQQGRGARGEENRRRGQQRRAARATQRAKCASSAKQLPKVVVGRSAHPSRPRLLGRCRRHQARSRRVLQQGLEMDAAACRRPADCAGALP